MDRLYVYLWTIAPIRLPGSRSRNTKLRTTYARGYICRPRSRSLED